MKEYYKIMCCCLLLYLITGNHSAAGVSDFYCSFRAAGYYPDYNADDFPISQIRFDLLTDIIYFSVYPNGDGSLNTSTINTNDPNTMEDLIQAAKDNNVKISICLGGAGFRSDNFSTVVADPVKRATLINQLVPFSVANGFDGIDLDWEPITDPNYATFIRELKAAMIPHSLKLSVNVYATSDGVRPDAFGSIDWLHVMAYDMYKYKPHSTYEDALAGLAHWESAGFPRLKMILGLPFFGRQIPPDGEYYSYKDIVTGHLPSPPDPNADEVDGINFNGINTIKAKTQYVTQNGYGGVMFWELTNDTMDETSLLSAAAEAVHANRPPDFNCDNLFDIADLNYLMSYWLMTGCDVENTWCQRCDLDASSTVDSSDFANFCRYWGFLPQGDINKNGHVNLEDFTLFAKQWLWTGVSGSIPEDIFKDGYVNLQDLALLAENWLIQ